MGIKDKLLAKTAGIKEEVDAEIAKGNTDKPVHPRTAIGHAGAFQVEISKSQERIRELEARVKDLEATTISIDLISPNPWQPRRFFDEAEIEKLAGSISEVGLIQPIVVRSVRNPDTQSTEESGVRNPDTFQIVAGERRWRATRALGKQEIKTIVIEASDEEMAALALAENFDREDLTAYEIALAIRNAEAAFPNRKSLAGALGINRTALYQYLAFFQLPAFIIDDLEQKPGYLGRDAAEDIAAIIKKHGDRAIQSLQHLWPRLKSGELDQGKIAPLIESSITRGERAPAQREIRKLFVGKEQAGSITRDAMNLTVKIRTAALTPEMEAELRRVVEGMFKS